MPSANVNPVRGQNLPMETEPVLAFYKDGLTFVPHYRNRKYFVGLGYGKHNFTLYKQADLLKMGAKPVTIPLWHRGAEGIVDKDHP